MEAATVTGPARNLIRFCRWTKSEEAKAANIHIEVTAATFQRPSDKPNSFVQALKHAGIPVLVIDERYRFDRGVLPQLARIVEELQPDIVQTHAVKSHFLLKLAGLHRNRVWLAFQHGYTATDLKGRLYNELDRWSLRSAAGVVSVCGAFVPQLIRYGARGERVRILHNSVDPPAAVSESSAAELRRTLGLDPDEGVILTIGRMSHEKGHADLVQALARLRDARPEERWKAVFVGDGPERSSLEPLSERLSVRDRIVFAGFRSDVALFYAIAGMFVLPSHSEGSPNVLLEAMAARVPVVSTRAGGVPEIVTHGETALLVPVGATDQLAESMAQLLIDESLRHRLMQAAEKRALCDFSPASYMRNLIAIYSDALSASSR